MRTLTRVSRPYNTGLQHRRLNNWADNQTSPNDNTCLIGDCDREYLNDMLTIAHVKGFFGAEELDARRNTLFDGQVTRLTALAVMRGIPLGRWELRPGVKYPMLRAYRALIILAILVLVLAIVAGCVVAFV